MTTNKFNGRRFFLTTTAKATVVLGTVICGLSTNAFANNDEKKLRLFNTHTGEELDIVFFRNGHYEAQALTQLNHFLRDHRENEFTTMDASLFDQLWDLQQRIGSTEVFEVISGYRSPKTNKKLRNKSSGVAKKSYHMKGRAIDIRLRGTRISTVHKAALSLKAGGVGYYPSSRFVHLDTGPVRNWA